MKKFISMVMAAAMVVSLVPATAFAATGTVTGDLYVENAETYAEDFNDYGKVGFINRANAAEVQFEIDKVKVNQTQGKLKQEFTVELDGAEFANYLGCAFSSMDGGNCPTHGKNAANHTRGNFATELMNNMSLDGWVLTNGATVRAVGDDYVVENAWGGLAVKVTLDGDFDETEAKFTIEITGSESEIKALEDDVLAFDLQVIMDGTDVGDVATVAVSGDLGTLEATTFAEVVESGIKVSCKEAAEVAEDEETYLKKDVKIESVIGNFAQGQEIELSLSRGFEFVNKGTVDFGDYTIKFDGDEATMTVDVSGKDELVIKAGKDNGGTFVKIEAVDAKAGAECVLKVEAEETKVSGVVVGFEGEGEAVIAKVLADELLISVEDEDVPVIYSGVGVNNWGITDNSKHMSLEVTIEESVADAWDFKPGFEMSLTEGVFVTGVTVTDIENVKKWDGHNTNDVVNARAAEIMFAAAYEEGNQESFVIERKTIDAVDGKKAEISFKLELVAEPNFVGDVVLTIGEAEVVIATFVAPYTVEAAQNDLIIDYRHTEVPTSIVVKEAEAGLWEAGTQFWFEAERMDFEDDATFAVNEESEMEIKDGTSGNVMYFTVDETSDDEAAVVTISGIELYMGRELAAGAYDLFLSSTLLGDLDRNNVPVGFLNEKVLAVRCTNHTGSHNCTETIADNAALIDTKDMEDVVAGLTDVVDTFENTYTVGQRDYNFQDGWYTVKEGYVNIITAGRDQDDASFTKKVVVPVGEMYLIAGEDTVALDVPAYINAAGYTMLPVRAVATALGINNNNVIWSQAAKQVTILYGQRIITMTVGQSVIYVNGSAIPASAAVEVVDGRAFLGLRDLANALGVTNIAYDAATKTATLN